MYPHGTIVVCVTTKGLERYINYFSPGLPVKDCYYTVRKCRKDVGSWGILLNEITGKVVHTSGGTDELAFDEGHFRPAESSHDEKVLVQSLQESK